MTVQHKQEDAKGLFFIQQGETTVGEMEIEMNKDNNLVITHTEVHEQFRGQGVGELLVEYAIEYARANSFRIVPLCRYANAVLTRKDDVQDILKQ